MSPDNIRLTKEQVLAQYTRDSYPDFDDVPITNVNQVGSCGDRPIHIACIHGSLSEVVALVEGGADVNVAGDLGYTPLHHAASDGHYEIVKELLSYGADVTAKNEFGQTPMDIARDMIVQGLLSAKKPRS